MARAKARGLELGAPRELRETGQREDRPEDESKRDGCEPHLPPPLAGEPAAGPPPLPAPTRCQTADYIAVVRVVREAVTGEIAEDAVIYGTLEGPATVRDGVTVVLYGATAGPV